MFGGESMGVFDIKVDILPTSAFLKVDGTFDKEAALNLSGKIAGVCYDREGFNHLLDEPVEKTNRRIDMTLNNGHHSVYDHIMLSFNFQNVPKILAMVLNNEHQYTTSEKSARYTPVEVGKGSVISEVEVELYNKWMEIFQEKIKEKYSYIYSDGKIKKLAQENSRYLVTVFMPTQMVYTTSLRQINYIASWMKEYVCKASSEFERKLACAMEEFMAELYRINVLEEGLMKNEKRREFSLFGKGLIDLKEYFGDVYCASYKGTFAQLAQSHRHRTLDYKMEFLDNKEYYIPPIIKCDDKLVREWLEDLSKVKDVYPQGELVLINECGKYSDFILKCKERLCSAAQLEIAVQTKDTLEKYRKSLEESGNPLKNDIKNYCRGARCTFKDFVCTSDCCFKEGKLLNREV